MKKIKATIVVSLILFQLMIIIFFGLFLVKQVFPGQSIKQIVYTEAGTKYIEISVIVMFFTIILAKLLSQSISIPVTKMLEAAKEIKEENIGKHQKKDEFSEQISDVNISFKNKFEKIAKEKAEIETVLKHMTDGLISFNLQGEITQINPAAIKYLQIEENEKFSDILKKQKLDLNIDKILYMNDLTNQNIRIENKDKYYDIFFTPLRNESGRAYGITMVIQDVTEHVKLGIMRRRFVADVSHELKTPITTIMGYSETLLDDDLDVEMRKKFLTTILSESHRMSDLVQDLLTLSKYDSSEITTNKEWFNLGELTKKCVDLFRVEAEKKNIHLSDFVTADVPDVYAEEVGIEKVLINILSNAIKYTGEDGEINIYTGYVKNFAYVKVKDNGIGIKPEDQDKVFERFYRVDSSRVREKGGTGLGLAIAKEIMIQNNGYITLNSKLHVGSEFTIQLPIKNKEIM